MQELLRFAVGGLVVSLFAILGDVLKPKRFAGLFGAAPSVALATLTLTIGTYGKQYAATESRSLIAGAVALGLYALTCSHLMMCRGWSAPRATTTTVMLWLAVVFGIWAAMLR